jgi:hypothetical protein
MKALSNFAFRVARTIAATALLALATCSKPGSCVQGAPRASEHPVQVPAATRPLGADLRNRPPSSCLRGGDTFSVELFESVTAGKVEHRETIRIFPISGELRDLVSSKHPNPDDPCFPGCALIAGRVDLNGDGREDYLAYARVLPGSSGDYLWFGATNCGDGRYQLAFGPTWTHRLNADQTHPRSSDGWLDLLALESNGFFPVLERYQNSGAGYVSAEPPPSQCPSGIEHPNRMRLQRYRRSRQRPITKSARSQLHPDRHRRQW